MAEPQRNPTACRRGLYLYLARRVVSKLREKAINPAGKPLAGFSARPLRCILAYTPATATIHSNRTVPWAAAAPPSAVSPSVHPQTSRLEPTLNYQSGKTNMTAKQD